MSAGGEGEPPPPVLARVRGDLERLLSTTPARRAVVCHEFHREPGLCGWQTTIDPLGSGAGIRLWYDDYADVLRLTVGTSDWFWHDVHLVEAVAADVGDIVDAVLAGRAWDRGGHLEVVTEDGRRHVSDPWVDPWFTKRWWARKSAPVRPSRRLPPYDTDV